MNAAVSVKLISVVEENSVVRSFIITLILGAISA